MRATFSTMCYIFLLPRNQKLVNLICIIQIYNFTRYVCGRNKRMQALITYQDSSIAVKTATL